MPAKPWNDSSGDWQGLESEAQVPRYRAIARIVDGIGSKVSVLDIGCGEAVLRDYLGKNVEYFGIEPSATAAGLARRKCGDDHIFHTTGEEFDPANCHWDCVIFNEVLYYSLDPVGLLARFAPAVGSHGTIVTSIYQRPGTPSLMTRVRHLLDRRRPMGNVHCSEMVQHYMVRSGWMIESDTLVRSSANRGPWRIIVSKPPQP